MIHIGSCGKILPSLSGLSHTCLFDLFNRLGGARPYKLRKRERGSGCWSSRTKHARTTTFSGRWRPP